MTQHRTVPLGEATVAIIGLGLLGGSLGRALSARCARRIGVVEAGDSGTRRTALVLDTVDEVEVLEHAVTLADVVVLATPVRETLRLLPDVGHSARPGTLITDLGGSKVAVGAAMDTLPDALHCVGGHPMCGGTESGLAAADPALFDGARWALCATSRGGDEAVARMASLVETVGADPVIVDSDEHDRAVALVSHLPRLVAVSLMRLLHAREPVEPLAGILAARGWRGATRLAAGDERMWDDVLATNGAEVAAAARELAAQLEQVAQGLVPPPSRAAPL